MNNSRFTTVDEYIKAQPAAVKAGLKLIRQTVKKAAPDAEEVISYNMPAYKFHGMLLYFAAHTAHIGLYAMPGAIIAFKEKIKMFVTSKGTIQFPVDKPIPVKLINDIVKFRAKENIEKAKMKKAKNPKLL
jgi:uncharacterized protein YdhG (YjbR/CyaY superfamily)